MANGVPFAGQKLVLWIPDDVPCFDAGLALALPPAGSELASFLDKFKEAERWARDRRADFNDAPALIAGGLRRIPIVWPHVLRCCAPAFRPKTLHAIAKHAGSLKLSGKPFDAGTPCLLLEDEAEILLGLCGADFENCTGVQAFFCIQTQSDAMFRTGLMLSCPSKAYQAPACVTVSIDVSELCQQLSPYASREVCGTHASARP